MREPLKKGWAPDWVSGAVFYHIYPLGFLGAPTTNDGQSPATPRLAELRRWYDHIAGLGVNAIYFGPVFESGSHGYDTIDYFQIDRRLGDVALFRDIVNELHGRGIKVILDGVFHHTGRQFFAFEDLRQRGRESQYTDWYYVNWGADSKYGDGFAYDCWEGHEGLPRLNLDHPAARDYVLQVARMWLGDFGVDGWRLDVASQISPEFWWEFRRACKAVNPECFLVGEVIAGDYRTWVAPDLLDGCTDYQLYKAITSSLNSGNFWELKSVMERAMHPEWGLYTDLALLTFVGNHDVTRIASLLNSPRLVYPALIFLLTAPGIPCLYYGDEVGMTGRKEDGDAALRAAMPLPDDPWPDGERASYRETARLIGLRREHPALTYGSFAPLAVTHTTFSYLRQHSREWAVAAINSGETAAQASLPVGAEGVPDGVTFRDVLDPQAGEMTVRGGALDKVSMPPGWGRVLVAARG